MSEKPVARRDIIRSLPEPGWNYCIERSPFYEFNIEDNASFCVYNRRLMTVSVDSVDRDTGYWALRRDVVRLDTGELPTEIVGPDAALLLDRIFTRRVSTLKPGRCTYGIACWEDGGVLVDGILARLDENRYWYVQADGDFVGWLKAHAIGLDVEIKDPQSWVHQIQGPKSLELLSAAADGGGPESFKYFDAKRISFAGQEVWVTRTGWTSELGFEIYTEPGIDSSALWRHFTEIGKQFGLVDVGLDSFDPRRIEAGILNNLSDVDETMTPFEAGLGAFVDLERDDDFFGKEALMQADQRTRLYGVQGDIEPLIGSPVYRDGAEIGIITAGAWSPYLDQGIGYIRLHDADQASSREAEVTSFDLECRTMEIVDLPFYDPQKRISRGLEATNV